MSRTSRAVRQIAGAGLAIAIVLPAVTTSATARPAPGSEFDRITADLRAAVRRHDPRLYHAFRRQLEVLVSTATTT